MNKFLGIVVIVFNTLLVGVALVVVVKSYSFTQPPKEVYAENIEENIGENVEVSLDELITEEDLEESLNEFEEDLNEFGEDIEEFEEIEEDLEEPEEELEEDLEELEEELEELEETEYSMYYSTEPNEDWVSVEIEGITYYYDSDNMEEAELINQVAVVPEIEIEIEEEDLEEN